MTLDNLDTKDPDEVKDYSINWAREMAQYDDTIDTSLWIVPAGITKLTDTHGTTSATIWLEDGVLGANYLLTNRITTAGGRILDQSITIRVRAR